MKWENKSEIENDLCIILCTMLILTWSGWRKPR